MWCFARCRGHALHDSGSSWAPVRCEAQTPLGRAGHEASPSRAPRWYAQAIGRKVPAQQTPPVCLPHVQAPADALARAGLLLLLGQNGSQAAAFTPSSPRPRVQVALGT